MASRMATGRQNVLNSRGRDAASRPTTHRRLRGVAHHRRSLGQDISETEPTARTHLAVFDLSALDELD